jgi:glycosyltransferase involved in cell wall biosynthesis
MKILLLCHYPLTEGPSMQAFAHQIADGLRKRGHTVRKCTAPVRLARLACGNKALSKWLGYVDKFVLFPPQLWKLSKSLPSGTLFVFADQALGPWIPLLKNAPHLVHVHDLLALEAAQGQQPFHKLPLSGQLYQRWICLGFRQARCFLSVSGATCASLKRHLPQKPLSSEILYNPLQSHFRRVNPAEAANLVAEALPCLGTQPFLLHIGRNWYKNRLGVLAIWEKLQDSSEPRQLVMVGALDQQMQRWLQERPHLQPSLHVLNQASNSLVVALYNRADSLLFPSHAEGFGWPILEALACVCPVVTTDRAPMTEVGGDSVTYIPPAPSPHEPLDNWALQASYLVLMLLARSPAERERSRRFGYEHVQRFGLSLWLDQLEAHYQRALALQETSQCAN